MAYYLQALLGGILLLALVIPMSNNYKEIKVKNIFYAILVMVLFGFLLLSDYVTDFFRVISDGVAKLSSATADGTSFLFGTLFEAHPYALSLIHI